MGLSEAHTRKTVFLFWMRLSQVVLVSSGTLNSSIPYHTRLLRAQPAYSAMHKKQMSPGK